jgi:hypothetical protein
MLPLHQSPRRPPLYWAPRPFRPNQVRTYVREMGASRSRCLRLPARLVFRRWVDRRYGPRLPARDHGRFGVSRDRAGVPRRAARCRPGPARAAATAPPGRAVRVSALVVLEPLRRRPRAFSAPRASASGSDGRRPTRATSRSRTVAASLARRTRWTQSLSRTMDSAAGVVELVDTPALGAGAERRGGSNPSARIVGGAAGPAHRTSARPASKERPPEWGAPRRATTRSSGRARVRRRRHRITDRDAGLRQQQERREGVTGVGTG